MEQAPTCTQRAGMRYQGRITTWKDAKGFGFITPNGGGEQVFVHISSFSNRQHRPIGNEIVTYELKINEKGRTQESTLHLFALLGGWPGALTAQRLLRHKSAKTSFQIVFWVTVALNCGALGWLLSTDGAKILHSVLGTMWRLTCQATQI